MSIFVIIVVRVWVGRRWVGRVHGLVVFLVKLAGLRFRLISRIRRVGSIGWIVWWMVRMALSIVGRVVLLTIYGILRVIGICLSIMSIVSISVSMCMRMCVIVVMVWLSTGIVLTIAIYHIRLSLILMRCIIICIIFGALVVYCSLMILVIVVCLWHIVHVRRVNLIRRGSVTLAFGDQTGITMRLGVVMAVVR